MSLSQAAQWYPEQAAAVQRGLKNSDLPAELQLLMAYKLRQAQPQGAMDPLVEPGIVAGGCFVKGTRVHTKGGLKPIEQIQVGDYVLSSPEDGTGTPEYKRVLNTFVHEDKSVMNVTIYGPGSETQYFLAATGNHPFWVEGTGWTRADQLKPGFVLRRSDETFAKVAGLRHVYRTESEGIGWIAQLRDVVGSYGSLFDYANYASAPKGPGEVYLSKDVYESADPYLKVRVYNLEVEDFHTYYVGAKGFWVHNANCARVELANGKGFSQRGNSPLDETECTADFAVVNPSAEAGARMG